MIKTAGGLRNSSGKFVKGHQGIGNVYKKGHKFIAGGEKGWFKSGKENHNWKGKTVGYRALHTWVTYYRGSPKKCEMCKTTKAKQFDWASKSHEYKRDLNDWIRLCPKCHAEYDKKYKFDNTKKHKW